MPVYKFTSNGKTIKVTGDTPPSESELDDIFKAAGVSTDVGSSTTVPEAPSVAQLASAKTPAERIAALKDTPVGGDLQKVLSLARLWATNGPHAVVQGIKDFMGGDYAKGAHEAISGAGITALPMVAGPAVMAAAGAPVTAAATLAGGYAGGKLAPMAAEALGATPDQSALAGDVGMVAGGAAGGRLLQMPARAIAKGALNATAAALDNPVAGVVSPRARNLGEMAGKLADAIKANPAAAEEAGVHLDLSKRVQAGSLTQQQIGERLAAAKAQGMNAPAYEPATNPAEPVRVPLPQQPQKPVVQAPVVRPQATGTSMQPAAMPTPRAAVPVPEGPPEPSMAKPATPTKSPQQILNEEAIAKRRAAYQESLKADAKPVIEDVEAGKMTAEQAAAELAKRWGTPSDAERRFPPNKSGLPSNPPTARKARGKVSDLADMKVEPLNQVEPKSSAFDRFDKQASDLASEVERSKEHSMRYQADLKDQVGKAIGISGDMLDLPYPQWSSIRKAFNSGDISEARRLALMSRGKVSDLADMPIEPPKPEGPTAENIASVQAATRKKFSGKIADLTEMLPATQKYAATQAGRAEVLDPEIDYALKWIEQDMEAIPYTSRTVIDHPDKGMGGSRLGVGGSAGAKIYRNIVGEEGSEISGAKRGDVLKAIKNLREGKVTPVGELVLGVARDLKGMSIEKLQKLMATPPP